MSDTTGVRDALCRCGHWAHDHTFLGEVCTVCDCDQYAADNQMNGGKQSVNDTEHVQDALARAIWQQLTTSSAPMVVLNFDDPRFQTRTLYSEAEGIIAALADAGYTIVKQDAGRTGAEGETS